MPQEKHTVVAGERVFLDHRHPTYRPWDRDHDEFGVCFVCRSADVDRLDGECWCCRAKAAARAARLDPEFLAAWKAGRAAFARWLAARDADAELPACGGG